MIIEKIHIINFGKLSDFTLDLAEGVNIIQGKNEAGKSTISAFIKFMFYGLSSDADERARSISWHSATAAGTLTLREGQDLYRIEREAVTVRSSEGKATYKERCAVINAETGKPLYKGKVPGEVFFGIPRGVFESTAFIGQLEGSEAGGRPLAEATENILFSADETVNTKKALKKLDEARVHLYHKNRKGGKIYEYSKERSELAEKLAEAQKTSADIINAEGTLRALGEAHERSKHELDKVNGELTLHERYIIKQNYLKLRDESAKSDEAEKELKSLSSERFGTSEDKFISNMEREKFELLSLESAKKTSAAENSSIAEKLAKLRTCLNAKLNLDENENKDELEARENIAQKSISLWKTMLIISAVLAVLCAVGILLFPLISVASAILMAVCIASIIKYISARKKAELIYTKLGAQTRHEFYKKLSDIRDDEAAIRFTESTKKEAEEKVKEADKKYHAKKSDISRKLSEAGFSVSHDIASDIDKAISAARANSEKRLSLLQTKSASDTRIKEIVTTLDNVPDSEKEKAISTVFDDEAMKRFDVKGKKKERDFLASSLTAQKEKIHSIECDLASMNAMHARPAEIAQAITAISAKIDDMSEKFDAYMLAMDAITAASDNLRDGISPQIAKNAGKIMEDLSLGKYGSIFLDSEFAMSYTADGITRNVATLSAGTSDIAYISLRIALAETLCKHKIPPFVFDESFTRLDDERLRACLDLIARTFQNKGQAIIFTCHDRENMLAKNTIPSTSLSI